MKLSSVDVGNVVIDVRGDETTSVFVDFDTSNPDKKWVKIDRASVVIEIQDMISSTAIYEGGRVEYDDSKGVVVFILNGGEYPDCEVWIPVDMWTQFINDQ
jgi:hypothetical protein